MRSGQRGVLQIGCEHVGPGRYGRPASNPLRRLLGYMLQAERFLGRWRTFAHQRWCAGPPEDQVDLQSRQYR